MVLELLGRATLESTFALRRREGSFGGMMDL